MSLQERIQRLMTKLQVRAEDFEESFVRSQGSGGQNVNKVETCVCLKHVPTGITVKCQSERLQSANRLLARELLLKKIEIRAEQKRAEQKAKAEKERRKKRGRSKQGKMMLREQKQWNTQKKRARQKVRAHKFIES